MYILAMLIVIPFISYIIMLMCHFILYYIINYVEHIQDLIMNIYQIL